MTIKGFTSATADVNGQRIHYTMAGSGPPLLLLHGFPQTHAMWHGIAPTLAQHFTTVAADLRGYGASSKPQGSENYSFREMAADQVALMAHLGFDSFHLVGHDRGGRTSHRAALDYPDTIRSLTLMDIVPTYLLLTDLQQAVARAYYHWFFLAQPAPMPETMIGHDPDAYFEYCLTGWGKGALDSFDPEALEQYRTAWRDPETIRAMCDDYRAAIDHDMALDAADLGRRVTCPALVLSGANGVMAKHYDVGATWVNRLSNMQVDSLPGGHFFPDQYPSETADKILEFLLKAQPDAA
ncbi:alpha/beta fold hydrolase [Pseudosulfitobacter pseudonitzschiae]|uniref:alpha/beta fold hydrolase n=1 Tax=Pseudosulfitobacter pseudonitzschiae TaxID=1402135 RepID=UPI001AF06971|nr:alpha/beta hydrolase [Pseudosulfitobacter pseudonitzschiae]MBM1814553.1 alpha/beta hydrolase [Pseudosulfitobacter pseudonitzschiae]MBM1831547.1 alpha/beta hydrolase [Pseudosulfitobacter pseudonitzschiae]MBM1836412.1 alpha/beta hydrolase [Pseudosulfitobacter pseudonitzschiae]MBM1841259.1 alpha/beta hydrolase [Pseudosulfitobacter pseudonitzschiae]MBM1846126.1 alpha/beta hydrolase [Pseudosulfitobacter pseudonitzschiae]